MSVTVGVMVVDTVLLLTLDTDGEGILVMAFGIDCWGRAGLTWRCWSFSLSVSVSVSVSVVQRCRWAVADDNDDHDTTTTTTTTMITTTTGTTGMTARIPVRLILSPHTLSIAFSFVFQSLSLSMIMVLRWTALFVMTLRK